MLQTRTIRERTPMAFDQALALTMAALQERGALTVEIRTYMWATTIGAVILFDLPAHLSATDVGSAR